MLGRPPWHRRAPRHHSAARPRSRHPDVTAEVAQESPATPSPQRSPASAPPSKYGAARGQEPPHAPAPYPYELSYGRPQHQRPKPQTTVPPSPPSITIKPASATRRRHTAYS